MKDLTPKDKAKELVDEIYNTNHCGIKHFPNERYCDCIAMNYFQAKQCALIAVSNEYHSLRELLFNLRSCKVIESEKVYLHRLNQYIEEEKEVKQEIEKL
jgi:hypothetical protein